MIKKAKEEVETIYDELSEEAPAQESPAAESHGAVTSIDTYCITLAFPPEDREFTFHGAKVDVSSIKPEGLKYLIGLGFTTSLTQCNAGRATAMKEEGLPQAEIDSTLAANRDARLQKICDGSIAAKGGGTGGGGGPRKALDARLLEDMAWAGLQAIYSRNKAKLPKPGAEKAKAIADYLSLPHNRKRCEQMVAAMMGIGEDA
jgi:hypothetical protein